MLSPETKVGSVTMSLLTVTVMNIYFNSQSNDEFGEKVETFDDEFVEKVEKFVERSSTSTTPLVERPEDATRTTAILKSGQIKRLDLYEIPYEDPNEFRKDRLFSSSDNKDGNMPWSTQAAIHVGVIRGMSHDSIPFEVPVWFGTPSVVDMRPATHAN